MTVEEYYNLPERDDVILELHWGRLVELSRPKPWHITLQRRISDLLRDRCGPEWEVFVELPFRAVPQYDLRAADVGVIAKRRWDAVGRGDLQGSPEIVIEVLSPSNSRGETTERASLFLVTGTQQFCEVDEARRIVRVTFADGTTMVYGCGERVPFPLLDVSLGIDEIFASGSE